MRGEKKKNTEGGVQEASAKTKTSELTSRTFSRVRKRNVTRREGREETEATTNTRESLNPALRIKHGEDVTVSVARETTSEKVKSNS